MFGIEFKNQNLLRKALTHKSFAYENPESQGHNESLEFLGDAVLDLIFAEMLMLEFSTDDEGALSKKRASLVNESVLAEQARKLELQKYIHLGKGEIQSGGAERSRILSAAYEALVGACFQDQGYEQTRNWVWLQFKDKVIEISKRPDFEKDFKTRLQELSQEKYKKTPIYSLIEELGPAHEKSFRIQVQMNDQSWIGEGSTKKSAEQAAAEKAFNEVSEQEKK